MYVRYCSFQSQQMCAKYDTGSQVVQAEYGHKWWAWFILIPMQAFLYLNELCDEIAWSSWERDYAC